MTIEKQLGHLEIGWFWWRSDGIQSNRHLFSHPSSTSVWWSFSLCSRANRSFWGRLGGDRKKQIVISPCSRVQDKSIVGFLKDGCNRINLLWLHVLASGHVYIIAIWYSSVLSSILFIRVKTCKEFSSMTSLLPLDRFGKKNQLPSTWS